MSLAKALWCALLLVTFTVENGLASNRFNVPITPVAQITIDDEGDSLEYPYTVFYDPVVEEIYIVNVGSSRVVVYGPDYFPRVSIGRGRGVAAPISGAVLSNGDVYVGQVKNKVSKSNRITILNGAFFPKKEIILDDIPEVAGFYPTQFAVSRDGKIYLGGDAGLGVLVLDNDGRFLHRIQPMDKIDYLEMLQEWDRMEEESALYEEQQQDFPIKKKEAAQEKPDLEEKKPSEKRRRIDPYRELRNRPKDSEGNYPVRINHVSIDSDGRLYLLSPETSKVYVYDSDENFIFSFGERGGTPGKMSQPKSIVIDEKRQLIYIADYMRHTILVYRMFTGEYLFEFGGRGAAPGWFNFPNGLAINSQDQLLVADYFNQRIQVLDVGFNEPPPLAKDNSSPPPAAKPLDNLDAAEAEVLVPAPQEDTVEGPGQGLDQDIVEEVIEEEIIPGVYPPALSSTSGHQEDSPSPTPPATKPSDNLDAAEKEVLVPAPQEDTVEGPGQGLDRDIVEEVIEEEIIPGVYPPALSSTGGHQEDSPSPTPATKPSDNLDAAEKEVLVPAPQEDTVEGPGQNLDQDIVKEKVIPDSYPPALSYTRGYQNRSW